MDSAGNLYVADTLNHTIRKITLPAGDVTTPFGVAGIPGSANGNGTSARFNGPTGLTADSAWNLYVADTLNHTIRKITLPAGDVTTPFGVVFHGPTGVTMDSAGNLYVA